MRERVFFDRLTFTFTLSGFSSFFSSFVGLASRVFLLFSRVFPSYVFPF